MFYIEQKEGKNLLRKNSLFLPGYTIAAIGDKRVAQAVCNILNGGEVTPTFEVAHNAKEKTYIVYMQSVQMPIKIFRYKDEDKEYASNLAHELVNKLNETNLL